jgi:hypothetical protein
VEAPILECCRIKGLRDCHHREGWGRHLPLGIAFVGWKLDEGELVEERAITLVVNNAEHTVKAVFMPGCGLGIELVLLLPPLMWLHNRRKRRRT